MKKQYFILIILLILVQVTSAVLTNNELTSEIIIQGGIHFIPQSQVSIINSARAELFLLPKTEKRQEVLSITTAPTASISESAAQYFWKTPDKEITYSLRSVIKTQDNHPVQAKDSYPIQNLPEDLMKYLQPSKIITSNDIRIIEQANKIAQGNTDLFILVTKLADWTKQHITYNLTTLTAEVAQTASWVLEQREGVCDELTSLFIAMLRSLGIPARFVSGISYTNSPLVENNWGSHGWAEVWFPSTGLVSFDPTFGQYGWIDTGHVKLKDSIDPSEKSVQFVWQARDIKAEATPLLMTGKILQQGKLAPEELTIHVELLHKTMGFGSANIVRAQIKNNKPYYTASRLQLATSPELSVETKEQLVIIPPQGETNISWLVTTQQLQKGFSYTIPLLVVSSLNESSSATLTIIENEPVYTREDMLVELSAPEQKNILTCMFSQTSIVQNQKITVTCEVPQEYQELCLASECKKGANTISFEISYKKPGFFTQHITTRDKKYSTSFVIHMEDTPQINIQDITTPLIIEFNEEALVSWKIMKNSISNPKKTVVALFNGKNNVSWNIEPFEQQTFSVNLQGRALAKENNLIIKTIWQDSTGKEYFTEQKVYLKVQGNWWQNILLWVNGILAKAVS